MSDVIDCDFTVEGSGPPLVLIHGIGAARDAWRFVIPHLRSHFTVVSYDLRGHGTSPLPKGKFGLDDLVADLERVRLRAGFERAHIAGHSLGGMIAPAYARANPDRVFSLGLLSTAAGRSEEDSAGVRTVIRAMEEKGIDEVLDSLTERFFSDAFIEAHPEIVQRGKDQVIEMDADVFMRVLGIHADTEMLPWLPEVAAPSLVLTGGDDEDCNPRLNRLVADALPDAELVILPGYKHSILLEAYEEVAAHLVRFMGGD